MSEPEHAPAQWDAGWYALARHCVSPNYGPRPRDASIDLVVLHSISLPPGQYGGDAVQQLFTNQLDWQAHPYYQQITGLQVSAHFFIRRDGALWQFVSCDDRAWHAGRSQHSGRENCNDFSIGVELEGLDGDRFEAPQYGALLSLLEALRARYPIAHVAGHEHIAPDRKQDPGAGFDWAFCNAMPLWRLSVFPRPCAFRPSLPPPEPPNRGPAKRLSGAGLRPKTRARPRQLRLLACQSACTLRCPALCFLSPLQVSKNENFAALRSTPILPRYTTGSGLSGT